MEGARRTLWLEAAGRLSATCGVENISNRASEACVTINYPTVGNPQTSHIIFLYSLACSLARSLAPTTSKVMEALGVGIGLKTVCIVGGIDMFQQVMYWSIDGLFSIGKLQWERGRYFSVACLWRVISTIH